MNRAREVTHSQEEQRQGDLEQKRQERGDLKHLPANKLGVAEVTDTQTRLGRWVVYCEILSEPLFHQDAEGGSRETEQQAGEP